VGDEHGVAVCCARMDGALRTCHDAVRHATTARSATDAGCFRSSEWSGGGGACSESLFPFFFFAYQIGWTAF
jgi:hypothetical protein